MHVTSRRTFLQLTGAAAGWLSCAGGGLGQTAPAAAAPAGKHDLPLKLGIASYSFRSFDLAHALAMTTRLGLKHICLKSFHLPMEAKPQETAAAAAQVARAGLVLGSLGVVTMQKEAEVAHAFDYAKAAGVSMIVAAPSAPMLGLIEKKAKEYDIRIAIHNHGPGDKHFPTPQSVYEHIQDLDPRIGLCIDIGHTVRVGADLIDSTRKYADRLYEIHMKDVTGTTPKAHEIQVGRGVIDIRAFLRALIDVKYAGVVSFEYEGEPSDPLPGVAESVGYVKGALEARGRKVS